MTKHTKQRFAEAKDAIVAAHRAGIDGVETARALTQRLDDLLKYLYSSLPIEIRRSIIVFALGSYGRKELCFSSDTDIMFLRDETLQLAQAETATKSILHALLDYGLDVGHSFRTIEDCENAAVNDYESWMSLLESRYVCGSTSLFNRYRTRMQRTITKYDRQNFVRELLKRVEARRAKYGDSTKLLEPNIKNSVGGLRDLNSLFWLFCAVGKYPLSSTSGYKISALQDFLKSRVLIAHLDKRICLEAQSAHSYLLRVRNAMHLRSGSLNDTLEFASQRALAEELGYRATTRHSSVDRFMKDYYIAARAVATFFRYALNWAREHFLTELSPLYGYRQKQIFLRKKHYTLGNVEVLKAFIFGIEYGASLSHKIEDIIHKRQRRFSVLKTVEETALFKKVLNAPSGVAETLRAMNDLGLLASWIPEWKPLVAFFQHNIYHYYTADEHTIKVIANGEALSQTQNEFGEIFRRLPRRDVLYLACLLHDIAKPNGVTEHEITGVAIAGKVLRRLRCDDCSDQIQFLVRHHLEMEQRAFRRNLADPTTIIEFAQLVQTVANLDLLLLLTYADLGAVNKQVWTDWKAMLLLELYRKTKTALEEKLTVADLTRREEERAKRAVARLITHLPDHVNRREAEAHLESIANTSYLDMFDAEEIAAHLRELSTNKLVSSVFKHHAHFTEVTAIAKDAPFALSNICGTLSANDASIFDANIFTRADGSIIDKFRVIDFASHSPMQQSQCERIARELEEVFSGVVDTEQLLVRHRMKWKRKQLPASSNQRIEVEITNHPNYSIVDVYAPDMLGILYRITRAMSEAKLNIQSAKIASRLDGIVDSFYVRFGEGGSIPENEVDRVRRVMIAALEETLSTELSER